MRWCHRGGPQRRYPGLHCLGVVLDVTHGRLQTESDGKEILDDRVVQVAGNALPVFLECDAAQAFPEVAASPPRRQR